MMSLNLHPRYKSRRRESVITKTIPALKISPSKVALRYDNISQSNHLVSSIVNSK